MPLCRYRAADGAPRLGMILGNAVHDVAALGGPATLGAALQLPLTGLRTALDAVGARATAQSGTPLTSVTLLAPVDEQEVWAAGVTYLRSRNARMEESVSAKSAYDLVYEADRPEIFFKANAARVADPGTAVAIRGDSTWDVPEPELALVLTSAGELAGFTIGNDVSSRSIEGANPLYLPQAKVYDRCAGLGPVIALAWEIDDVLNKAIGLTIHRNGAQVFTGATSTNQIHRTLSDLIAYLFRNNAHPRGAILMTGTGIVPDAPFTLEHGDQVTITIEGIGTLVNPVIRLA
jgi:2-dehydro-3-deoxy-D-arabinonate dehydratase